MVIRSVAGVCLGLGVLCLAISGANAFPPNSGAFAVASAILIGSSLIALAIDGRK